MPKTGVMMMKI